MKRSVRTALFIFFVTLFVVATPSLILYAQGYRLNFPLKIGGKLIVKTGGFFVRAVPKQADIYIDGKLIDQTDFFFGSALVENLLPRQYHIEVKKAGYYPWEKQLEISEKQVTEARNIVLLPDNLKFATLEKNIDKIYPSENKGKIVIQGKGSDGWELRLYDISKNITSQLADEKDFSQKGATLEDLAWDKSYQKLDAKINIGKDASQYEISIDRTPARILKITDTLNATTTAESAKIAIAESNNRQYYLDAKGFIFETNDSNKQTQINKKPLVIEPESKYVLRVYDNYFFIQKDLELILFNKSSDSFEKVFGGLAGNPRLSPDGKKIVYFSNSEIWVFFLKNKSDQPMIDAGVKLFIARMSQDIKDCDWLTSDYLAFTSGNNIIAAEIDNRDKINMFNLAKISDITGSDTYDQDQRMIWDYASKTLLIYSNKNLYSTKIE